MHHIVKISSQLTWKVFESPSTAEIDELAEKLDLHPVLREELRAPTDRARVEHYEKYLFLVYHLPMYDETEQTSRRSEIDFIVTNDTIVTITYEKIESLEQLRNHPTALMGYSVKTTYELLYHLISAANHFSVRELKHIEAKVKSIGANLFKKRSNCLLLEKISYVKRDVLDFSIIAVSQRSTLDSLLTTGSSLWGNEAHIYFSDLIGDFLRLHYLLESLKANIESYSQTISQLLEFRTSEIIRRFSILGFLTVPLVLYSTIALQPKVEATFIATAADFWFIFGILFVVIVILAIIFRKKGWL